MTTPFGDIRVRQGRGLDEFEAPLIDVMGAAAGAFWYDSPLQQLNRLSQQGVLETGVSAPAYTPIGIDPVYEAAPTPKVLDAKTARARLKEVGVAYSVPESGVSEGWLTEVIRRRQEKAARDDILSRAPAGSLPWQLAAGLGVSMFDPLNVAASVIPVVGQARTAHLLAGASGMVGRTAVRAGVGAVEGAVGQAMLEPLTAYANSQEGIDYGMADAVRNIAFGGLLGGGLHVGAGIVGDIIARRTARGEATDAAPVEPVIGEAGQTLARAQPEITEAAFKVGVAQVVSGRAIDVDALVRLDPQFAKAVDDATINAELAATRVRELEARAEFAGVEELAQARAELKAADEALSVAAKAHASPTGGELAQAANANFRADKPEASELDERVPAEQKRTVYEAATAEAEAADMRVGEIAARHEIDTKGFLDMQKKVTEQADNYAHALKAAAVCGARR